MGKEDRDWYRGPHPEACNCDDCVRQRIYGERRSSHNRNKEEAERRAKDEQRKREREEAERRAKEEQTRKERERGWEDYYEILDVNPEANDEEIKKAYRDRCFIFHPDRMKGAPESAQRKAEEELKRVNRAFNVLKDPAKRRDYHQEWLKKPRKQPYEAPRPPPSPANIVLSDFMISPQRIQLGGTVTVSLTARNVGGTVGSKTISMTGDFVDSRTVTLNPKASTVVQFTINPNASSNCCTSGGTIRQRY